MDQLRRIFEWIESHQRVTFLILILLILTLLAGRFVARAYSGQLTEPIGRGRIVDAVYGIGTVTAKNRLSFNPLAGSSVGRTFVREGDAVKKGQPLLETGDGIVRRAPFDGVVNYFPYRVGENAFNSLPMIVFTDMLDRYIVVSMEQQGALRVKRGQLVKLSFDSLRQQSFEGRVSAVYSYNGNFLARIDAVNLPATVLPDMTCDVAIVISEHQDALLIPSAAFEEGHVWVKRDGALPRSVPVKLGVVDGALAEVIDGDLQPGDRVMIRKQAGL
jgi:multidrug efflux pump subunit AcrA (membrane-fusion protein)